MSTESTRLVLTDRQFLTLRLALLDAASRAADRCHHGIAAENLALYDVLVQAEHVVLTTEPREVRQASGEEILRALHGECASVASMCVIAGGKWMMSAPGCEPISSEEFYGPGPQVHQGRHRAIIGSARGAAGADRQQADDERRNAWRAL